MLLVQIFAEYVWLHLHHQLVSAQISCPPHDEFGLAHEENRLFLRAMDWVAHQWHFAEDTTRQLCNKRRAANVATILLHTNTMHGFPEDSRHLPPSGSEDEGLDLPRNNEALADALQCLGLCRRAAVASNPRDPTHSTKPKKDNCENLGMNPKSRVAN